MTTMTKTAVMTPPIDWFRDPGLTEVTPVTITPEGRIYGHVAAWGRRHIGLPGHVEPPRSGTDYRWFHRASAQVLGDDGQPTTISAGNLTFDTGHAPMTAGGRATDRHYDDSGSIAAKVNAGEDSAGIWISGQVRPDLDEFTRWRITACGLSGDWRAADEDEDYRGLEMRAALFVPVEGFPNPRARVASARADEPAALVAAGMVAPNPVPNPHEETDMPETVTHNKGDLVEIVASGALAQVTDRTDDGYAVELLVGADEIKAASEEKALAASAAQQTRATLRSLTATVEQLQADLAARDRADEAARLLADVEV